MKRLKIKFKIKSVNKNDRDWVRNFIVRKWGSEKIVSRGRIYYPHKLSGFVAVGGKKCLGLITYNIKKRNCEIISLDSILEEKGIGTALVGKVQKFAKKQKCQRMELITTNDNIDGLRFWQKRGFYIKAVYPNAISVSRKLKPEIPLIGNYGIPVKDEIKLEKFIR